MIDEIPKTIEKYLKNGEYFSFYMSVKKLIRTYKESLSAKNPMGKLIHISSDDVICFASMLIMFLA